MNANVTINSDCLIEENCIINTASIVEHDVSIGKNSHIAPGVKLEDKQRLEIISL